MQATVAMQVAAAVPVVAMPHSGSSELAELRADGVHHLVHADVVEGGVVHGLLDLGSEVEPLMADGARQR
jgi:hypothetical protein